METKKFISILRTSFKDFYKNPVIFLPSWIIVLFIFLFQLTTLSIKNYLGTTIANILWSTLFIVLFISVLSYISAGLIGMSKQIITKKQNSFIESGNKFFIKNTLIFCILFASHIIINSLSLLIAYFVGKQFSLPVESARIIFLLIYFIGLVGWMIFLTFSSFYLVIENIPIMQSIRKSFKLVKSNYIYLLILGVFIFIIDSLITFSPYYYILSPVIDLLILPYIFIVLTRFVINK